VAEPTGLAATEALDFAAWPLLDRSQPLANASSASKTLRFMTSNLPEEGRSEKRRRQSFSELR
jgi:hypothetical protein